MITLRGNQHLAVGGCRAEYAKGTKSVLLCMPTGAGKTVVASYIMLSAIEKGKVILFLAHRRELLHQTVDKLNRFGVHDCNIIVAGNKAFDSMARVNVASVQTLIRRELPKADLIIIDEAHLACAKTYRDIVANYPESKVLGLSATPERLDGKPLRELFETMVEVVTIQDLMQQGFLMQPSIYGSAFDKKSLSNVRTRGGDYNESDLQDAMDTPKLNGEIVTNWKRYANDSLTVVFCTGIEHAQHVAEQFKAAGVSAEYVSGDMPKAKRESLISDWKRGFIRVMTNVGLFTEGFDFPELECCILARPTKSTSLYLQMIGRVLRTHKNKNKAIVLDHAGNVLTHGTPDIKRDWSLDGAKKKKESEGQLLKQCTCGFIFNPESKLFLVGSKLPKKEIGICACPSCNTATCVSCNTDFILKISKESIEDIAFTNDAHCSNCDAHYSDEKAHIQEDRESEIPENTQEILIKYDGSIEPISIKVKNAFKRHMDMARQRGFKRGWAFYKVVEEFGDEAKQHLPRHRGEWYKQVAV